MRTLGGVFPANFRRNPLVPLLFLAIALLGAYEAVQFILAGDMAGLAYVGMASVVAAFVVSMLNSWRRGVYIFFAWLLFEDFARKYLGNNMAIYFAKDFLVAVVYLSFFIAWRRKQLQSFRPPFWTVVVCLFWFGLIQVFNPASPHVVFGILGIKLYFYYIPLMFIGYALIDTELELRRFFWVNLLLMSLIAALGIAQSILGATFLNPGILQEDIRELGSLYRMAPISGVIVYRPSSVFVSTARYVDLLYIAWLLVLGFLGYSLMRYRKGRVLASIAVSLIAAGLVLSASRGAFMWGIIDTVVVTGAFFWGGSLRQQEAARILRTIARIGLGITLAIVLLLAAFPNELLGRLALYSETLSPDSPQSELAHRARDYPLKAFLGAFDSDRWPYGYGIGTSALGLQYVARIVGVKPPGVGVESGFGAIVLEIGIVGLVLWLIMSVAILVSAWRIVLRLRGSPWFPIGFVVFWFELLVFFPFMFGGIGGYQDFVLNAYLWFLLGVLFRLPHLKAAAELKSAELALAAQQPRWVT